jgi:hypothetical protein
MPKSREEIIKEMIEEEKKRNPNLKVGPINVTSNKRNSFAEFMQTQEQYDLFMKQLNYLKREIEERENEKAK